MFPLHRSRGDIIIKQGDDGDNFYIIDQGKVDVSQVALLFTSVVICLPFLSPTYFYLWTPMIIE